MNPNDFTPEELIDAEVTESKVSQWRASFKDGASSPEEIVAQRLKASVQTPKLSKNFDANLQNLLVQRFSKQAITQKSSFFEKYFSAWLKPSLLSGGISLAALGLLFQIGAFTPSVPSLAEAQKFASLSSAEEILGELPVDATTKDGIRIADLRASIHAINQIEAETDTSLDPQAQAFKHVELRRAALDIIETSVSIEKSLKNRELAYVSPQEISVFSGKVHKWPTQNEGVSYDVHSKAVNAFLSFNEDWDKATEELAKILAEELQDEK